MTRLNEQDLQLLSEQILECDPIGMIQDIMEWQQEISSDRTVLILDTVIDIIMDRITLADYHTVSTKLNCVTTDNTCCNKETYVETEI